MRDLARGWITTVLRGLAALLFGLGALLFPVAPSINLVALFGAYAVSDGVLALGAARASAGGPTLRRFLVGEGLVGIGAGLLALLLSDYWSVALPRLVAVWVLATGVLRLGETIYRRRDSWSGWLLRLAGLSSLPVSYLLLALPALRAVALIGAYMLGLGVILLVVAPSLHEVENRRPA